MLAKKGEGEYIFDTRGWICPYPKLLVSHLLRKLSQGDRLECLVDCPSAADEVPQVAQEAGWDTLRVEKVGDGEWSILLAGK